MSTSVYDFRCILNVHPDYPGFTCVGTTKKGQRCRISLIKGSDLKEAKTILDSMNRSDIHGTSFLDGLRRDLNRLAYLTLCPQWHRDKPGHTQVSLMVLKWFILVESYRQQRSTQQSLLLSASPYLQTHTSPHPNSSATYYAPPPTTPPHSQFPSPSPASPPTYLSSVTSHLASPPASTPHLDFPSPPPVSSPNPPPYTTHYPISPPSTPPHSASSTSASIHSLSSVFSHGNDSGYSTSHSTPPSSVHSGGSSSSMSDIPLPFQGPAVVYPSPPSSVWSLGPASETSSRSSSTSASQRSSHSSSSRRSQSSEQPAAQAAPAANPVLTSLAASIVASITPTLVTHLTTVLANTLGASESNTHLATAVGVALNATLSQILPSSAPLQSSAGTERSSRGSSRSSSQGSSRRSTQNSSATPAHPPQPIQQTSTSESSQSIAGPSTVAPRPLTDDCYVCYDALTNATEPVWCSQCGHVAHSECFQTWTEEQINQGRTIACGYCRSIWV